MAPPVGLRDWVLRYRQAGLMVCRIAKGSKRPTERGWPLTSAEPSEFGEGDNVGWLTGLVNDDLTCVDLDDPAACALADFYLPRTGCVDGRPGKPRSHRWYYAKDVPPGLTARTVLVQGGPATKRFHRAGDRKVILELLGSGRQAVVPPSLWRGQGGLQEKRVWEGYDGPETVPFVDLLARCASLAARCGWVPKTEPVRYRPRLFVPDRRRLVDRARRWLARHDPAVAGQGGWARTYATICQVIRRFDLAADELAQVVLEWNAGCRPPWRHRELLAKVEHALANRG